MTKEEAINFGKNILMVANNDDDRTAIEFTKMAISALEQESDEKMAMQYQEGYKDGFKKAQEIFARERR